MRGDYVELAIGREVVQDGQGGELEGIVIRIWSEAGTWTDDREILLACTIEVPTHEPPIALPEPAE